MKTVRLLTVVVVLVLLGFAMDVAAQPSIRPVGQSGGTVVDLLQEHSGALGIIATLLVIWNSIKRMLKPMVDSFTRNREEHDVMFEEYNIRNRGHWRRGLPRAHGVVALHPVPARQDMDL